MPTTDRRPGFWLVLLVSWGLLTVLSSLWALATPVGAAPDEPAHLIKAASVVRGQYIGGPSSQGSIVQVPLYIAYTQAETCYAFAPDQSAACIPTVPGDPALVVDATTTAGLYNPLYYAIVGWPSLILGDNKGIFAMRAVGAIATSLFLALAFALISRWRRAVIPIVGFAAAVTPMVLFLAGTVNPNSVEVAATLAAFVGMLTLVRAEPTRLWLPSTVVTVSAVVAANMRGLSLLWLALALLSPFMIVGRARFFALLKARPIQIAIFVTAGAVIAAAVWLLSTNSLGAAIDDPTTPSTAPGTGTSPLLGFAWTLFASFDYSQGIVGIFGWLDTPAPVFVFFVWALLAGGLLLLALVFLRGRALVLVLALTSALLLLPPILQGIYIERGGIIWQGRYILPVFVCAVLGASTLLADRIDLRRRDATALLVIVSGLWALAQFQSFATSLRRYAVGYHDGWLDLLSPEWTPPGGIFPSLIAFGLVGAIAGLFLVVVVRRWAPLESADVATERLSSR
ncbi:hypothetical protein BH11ACT4_BH11ACT4_02140 [soil metagenome]